MKKNTFEINGTKYEGIPAKTMELILDVLSPYVVKEEEPASAEEQLEALRPKNKSVSAKKGNTLDRVAYEKASREFGCWSEKRHSCWTKCRPVIYAYIGHEPEKYGKMTKKQAAAAIAKIKKESYS